MGGRIAVSQTVLTTKSSVRMLHRRGSDIFLRSEHRTTLGIDSSASSSGEGSTEKKKSPPCVSTTTESHGMFTEPLAGDVVAASADGHSVEEGDKVGGEKGDRIDNTSDCASVSAPFPARSSP